MAKASQAVSEVRCENFDAEQSEQITQDASLTEVLHLAQSSVETLKEFLSRLDTIVGDDFHQIIEKISETRDDMQLLNTKELDVDPLSNAENELKLVVKATEDATNRIMEAAETIMTADPEDPATYHMTVEINIM